MGTFRIRTNRHTIRTAMDSEPSVCERNGLTPNTPTVCEPTHVKNMNMNKEVATRLFRMLAVSEQTANTVKHDHASYAKLHLLSQQMQLLQAQATQTVTKSVAKAEKASENDIILTENCTALSAEYDDGAKRLLTIMAVDHKTAETIKRDTPACAKLSLLFRPGRHAAAAGPAGAAGQRGE